MTSDNALAAFGALAQGTRLGIIRRLVIAGHGGVPAGAIADALGVSPSNASFHLKELERAGLIAQRRVARSIIYTADYGALRGLIDFLMRDCCGGRPEICGSVATRAPTPKRRRVHA